MSRDLPDRFWTKFVRGTEHECWLWEGTLNTLGYGVFQMCGRQWKAHRLSYEALRGDIPNGLVIDHLCRVRNCVNPAHLEPVEPVENTRRGVSPSAINRRRTECVHGHPFTAENTWYDSRGRRCCLTCKRRAGLAAARKRRERMKSNGVPIR